MTRDYTIGPLLTSIASLNHDVSDAYGIEEETYSRKLSRVPASILVQPSPSPFS